MIYVILQYMKCTVFSSGHRENVVTIYNHVQMLVSTIHHDMFPCFLLNWKARPDVWTWAKDNPPWEDVPTNERGHETQVGLLPFLTGFLEAFDGWIGTGCRKPHRILRKAPFSHWWTSSSHLHVYIHIRIISMLIYIFGSNFRISINSYQVPFQKNLKFSSFQVIMMSIPPSGFSPPHFAWCRGEDRWVQADCFLGVVHISPIGGLYATYHLLGERNATIEVIFWTMGIHYPCPLSACIHLPTNPYQEHFCLNFNTGFRKYKVYTSQQRYQQNQKSLVSFGLGIL